MVAQNWYIFVRLLHNQILTNFQTFFAVRIRRQHLTTSPNTTLQICCYLVK